MNRNTNKEYVYIALILAVLFLLPGCSTDMPNDDHAISGDQEVTGQELDTAKADVISVDVSGKPKRLTSATPRSTFQDSNGTMSMETAIGTPARRP